MSWTPMKCIRGFFPSSFKKTREVAAVPLGGISSSHFVIMNDSINIHQIIRSAHAQDVRWVFCPLLNTRPFQPNYESVFIVLTTFFA